MSVGFPPETAAAMGHEPTSEQWRAISMPLEPYVLVAGAGSGKTSVMAARVLYLGLVASGRIDAAHDGVLPGNILCLTFTNKATENLTFRIRRSLSVVDLPEGEEPEIDNYHGFAAHVLERYGILAGIEPEQRVLTPAQRIELCARVLDMMPFEHLTTQWQPTVVDNILTLADQAANHLVEPRRIIEFNRERLEKLRGHRSERAYKAAQQRVELAHAVELFRGLKRDLGVIDFGDQIELALRVIQTNPSVAEEYRARFSAVLLDEYQDTNVAQAALMAGIFGDGHPVTAVGDPDQNIYAWRGASLFNLLEFPRQFPKADGTPAAKLPLYTNFRSGARILAAAERIIDPLPAEQRPDPDKRLEPWGPNGEGEVGVARFSDEVAEAEAIAARVEELHSGGGAWSGFAVLCRSSRLFPSLQRAFAEREIPVEIVGLAGLLKTPEVVEVLAYARAAADPRASVALGRILLGPRYCVGFKDLARVASWAKGKTKELREIDEEASEDSPYLFAEALEHLDEVEGISSEGRARLEEFRAELEELRAGTRRPVGEFLAEIIRRAGIATELDADPRREIAAAARRNLAAFLDEVHAFAPLEGDLTLRAFLDYVDTVEATDRPEWAPAQPSEENSVKVMTIHVAKGLEFDTVFVPGLAHGMLPNMRVQHNPAERGKSLDFELRGDAGILPRFDGVLSRFKDALRAQELIEERRTCYVALTRARRRLHVSGAHWYGETVRPKDASEFLDELAGWGEETSMAEVDRGPEISEENPLMGYREQYVRDWPGPALRPEADDLFSAGWRRAALEAAEEGSTGGLVASLGPEELEAYEHDAAEARVLASHLKERESEAPEAVPLPTTVSVGGIIDYARCPKRFYWTSVRPLPRFSGPAARIGSQVHAWIERRSSGQTSLIERDETPDLTVEELAGEPGKIERLHRAFLDSRFAGAVPLFAERAFLLHIDEFVIAGRIDAIYGTPGEPWEVVDYKTGRKPDREDPLASLQLDVYALACADVWGKHAGELKLTYLYLASGDEVTYPAGDTEQTRKRVRTALEAMEAGGFDPAPSDHCRWCDFLAFCEPGQRQTAEHAD